MSAWSEAARRLHLEAGSRLALLDLADARAACDLALSLDSLAHVHVIRTRIEWAEAALSRAQAQSDDIAAPQLEAAE